MVPAPRAGDGRGGLSYSTVVTILSRLHAKGLVRRDRAGHAFRYTPADQVDVAAHRMRRVLEGTEDDRDAVLTRFVSHLSGRDEELLRRLLHPEATPPAPHSAGADAGADNSNARQERG
jgi:predicted transcriptional regulator